MRKDKILDVLEEIDDKYINEAVQSKEAGMRKAEQAGQEFPALRQVGEEIAGDKQEQRHVEGIVGKPATEGQGLLHGG